MLGFPVEPTTQKNHPKKIRHLGSLSITTFKKQCDREGFGEIEPLNSLSLAFKLKQLKTRKPLEVRVK